MARFQYSLQNILNIKLKMETQAKQAFSVAKILLDEEEEKLFAFVERKSYYENEVRRLLTGKLNVHEIEDNKNAILMMDVYIEEQKKQVEIAERNLERARNQLTEVMRERKTYETLREQAFAEFLQEESKAESKTVDELVSYTYGQKRQVTE